jgi:hypothetical protein
LVRGARGRVSEAVDYLLNGVQLPGPGFSCGQTATT